MSKEEMRAAIERMRSETKPAAAPPAQARSPAAKTQKPGKVKKPPAAFAKFRLPEGATLAAEYRAGTWHGTLAGTNADGTPFVFECERDGIHRLARDLGRLWRDKYAPPAPTTAPEKEVAGG